MIIKNRNFIFNIFYKKKIIKKKKFGRLRQTFLCEIQRISINFNKIIVKLYRN